MYFCCWQGFFFTSSLGFLALVRKLVAEHHQIPPTIQTVSHPAERRPFRAKVCGQMSVCAPFHPCLAACLTSPNGPALLCRRGMLAAAPPFSQLHLQVLTQAVPAQSSAPRSLDFQPRYVDLAGFAQPVAVWPFLSGSCP